MRGVWGNFWLRSVAVIALGIVMALMAIWCTPFIARPLSKILTVKEEIYISNYGFHFTPQMLLAVIPAVPFWILAEPRLWQRREPLPLASYVIFLTVFFLVFYVVAYIAVFNNQENPAWGLGLLGIGYLGAAALAGGLAYLYYRLWRRWQDNLPPVIPDVF